MPGYRGVAETDISSSVEQNLRMAIHAVKSGVVPASSELAVEARVAQVRFHQGLRIEDVMRGYRLSMSAIQDRFLDIAHELGLGDQEILAAHRVLWGVSDFYTAALVHSYRESSVQQAVRDHELRQDYLRAVLAGSLADSECAPARQTSESIPSAPSMPCTPGPGPEFHPMTCCVSLAGRFSLFG